jgi:hypothetical protein
MRGGDREVAGVGREPRPAHTSDLFSAAPGQDEQSDDPAVVIVVSIARRAPYGGEFGVGQRALARAVGRDLVRAGDRVRLPVVGETFGHAPTEESAQRGARVLGVRRTARLDPPEARRDVAALDLVQRLAVQLAEVARLSQEVGDGGQRARADLGLPRFEVLSDQGAHRALILVAALGLVGLRVATERDLGEDFFRLGARLVDRERAGRVERHATRGARALVLANKRSEDLAARAEAQAVTETGERVVEVERLARRRRDDGAAAISALKRTTLLGSSPSRSWL